MSKSYKVAKKTINMGEKKGQTLFSVRPYSCNHLYFHTPSEPPLCKGDSRDVKNKK